MLCNTAVLVPTAAAPPESAPLPTSGHQPCPLHALQANLWTELVPTWGAAEYMLLPRLAAMAEALWSPPVAKSWPGFLQRLVGVQQQWERRGYRYRPLARCRP